MRYYITEMNKLYNNLHDSVASGTFTHEDNYDTLMLLDHVRCGIIKRSIQLN